MPIGFLKTARKIKLVTETTRKTVFFFYIKKKGRMKILLNMKHRKSYLKFSAASDVINEKDYFAKALIL